MAFAHLVYPGAMHSRLHHSLGAYHLMGKALDTLRRKGVEISAAEDLAARAAILLHDIGHGPFSHALEEELVKGVHHEAISLMIMRKMNEEFDGQLQMAIDIFTDRYQKKFLHQLVSGQLDVDRMDYLNRDSFFTGVAEGVIGYDRIIEMLQVANGELVVEEKAIYSIEKFLVSRRLMYWQVYLHKTVLGAERMLVQILRRARDLMSRGQALRSASDAFDYFLCRQQSGPFEDHLATFCRLDDHDVMATIKNWCQHSDRVLSMLCQALIARRLMKVKLQASPIPEYWHREVVEAISEKLSLNQEEAAYFAFTGIAENTTYNPSDERIRILFKDGSIRDISEVDNALIQRNLSSTVKKYYICFYRYQ
jgi:HD superfamily phosphohydrolase